jgi:hypothetical protein
LACAHTCPADWTLKDTDFDKAHKPVENRHLLKASIRGTKIGPARLEPNLPLGTRTPPGTRMQPFARRV